MPVYEIIYDYSNEFEDWYNCVEEFEGTWEQLMEYKRKIIENGCYHISIGCIADEEGEAW